MNLNLSEILELPVFDNSTIVAGRSGINNPVTLTTIMDVPDIIPWLHGGEMLFAANLFDSAISTQFLYRLKSKSVSAVVTKHAFINKLDNSLASLCDELKIPIITVPHELSWIDVTGPINELIAERQFHAIHQSQLFHSELISLVIKGNPLEDFCNSIEKKFGLSLALMNDSFNVISSTDNVNWKEILNNFSLENAIFYHSLGKTIKGGDIPGYIYKNEYLSSIDKKLFICPVIQNRIHAGYVLYLVSSHHQDLSTDESMEIDQIGLVLTIQIVKQQEISNSVRRYNNLLLDRILKNHSIDESERIELERSLNRKLHTNYYVILADKPIIEGFSDSAKLYAQNMQVAHLFRQLSSIPAFQDMLCFERENYLVFFLPVSAASIESAAPKLFGACNSVIGSMILCVSDPTRNAYLKAYNQALITLSFHQKNREMGCFYYSDLGILRFFLDKAGSLDTEFLSSFRSEYLQPLEEYDLEKGTQLKETLVVYITNALNPTKTWQDLFIHKNTLYARLKKIEALLSCDLTNSEDLFNIQMSIKIDQYLEAMPSLLSRS